MPDPTRPPTALAFAGALHALGLIPPLTEPQRRCLEALDGRRPPLGPRDRVATVRQAGRRYLRDLVAAHALATGHTVHLTASDAGDAARARGDVVRLAAAYLASVNRERPSREIAALLTVSTATRPRPEGEAPTCPASSSASSAPPARPSRKRSSATTAAG